MLAAFYEGQGRIAVRDVDGPVLGSEEVQLKVAYVGICGTDLHILDGDMDAEGDTPRCPRPRDVGHGDGGGPRRHGVGAGRRRRGCSPRLVWNLSRVPSRFLSYLLSA